jgi:hypothetical protein
MTHNERFKEQLTGCQGVHALWERYERRGEN